LKKLSSSIFFTSIICGSLFAGVPVNQFEPEHKEIIARFISSQPSLRLAAKDDFCSWRGAECSEYEESAWGTNPYYLIQDLNLDGHEDFAIVLYGIIKEPNPA
jgi:hypothetical protein